MTDHQLHFNYYAANIKKSNPIGTISLNQFFNAIANPKQEIIDTFKKIKKAELNGDITEKARLKSSLYSFTPSVIVNNNRSYQSIISFTGLMMLDFDHLDPLITVDFKNYLFNTYPFIIGTWLSASGCGVRALVNIPIVSDVDDFKALFMGLSKEIGHLKGFDYAPKNAVLPLFLSYDPNLIKGDTNDEWDTRWYSPKPDPPKQYNVNPQPSRVEKKIKSAIDKIIDNGHPQLRSTAMVLGGYVGAGSIYYDEAISLINQLIDNNGYLCQKASGYKKTAITMINKGMEKPLYL